MKALLFTLALVLNPLFPVSAADDMKAFPAAEDGMLRYVLELPEKADESSLKVELFVGKTVLVDQVNRHFFSGKIKSENIEGWGYTRYLVSELGPMASTRIGVDPNLPKIEKFVTLGGERYLIRYNSRLPVVVYVPAGIEVRYRVWSAKSETQPMDKG